MFVRIIIMGLLNIIIIFNDNNKVNARDKRTLVFPNGSSRIQFIVGAGFPVSLKDESVTMGYTFKRDILLPKNSTYFTNPLETITVKDKRDINTSIEGLSRLKIYKYLSAIGESFGTGGKDCVLRTICEASKIPFDVDSGIFAELFHVIFTPSTTEENLAEDYILAEIVGKNKKKCQQVYSKCLISFIDSISEINYY